MNATTVSKGPGWKVWKDHVRDQWVCCHKKGGATVETCSRHGWKAAASITCKQAK